MNCPGSHDLIAALDMPDTDEPEYRAVGTAAHLAAAEILTQGLEPWEVVGREFGGVTITTEMGGHLKTYVDYVTPLINATDTYGIEFRVAAPSIHEHAWGTADVWAIAPREPEANVMALHIADLKFGMGIVVEAEDNAQEKCYAAYVIDTLERERSYSFPDGMAVVLHIIQPRAFHPDGPTRTWVTTVGEIKEWVNDTLRPAMVRAEIDHTLTPGDWCRFCPAKLVCPMLQGLFEALCKVNPEHVLNWSDDSLDRSLALLESAEHAARAIREEAFKRALAGTKLENGKVVNKKANRVFKDDALEAAKAQFGDAAFTPPTLKSPPGIEALGPKGKAFVKEHAYTPFTGYSLAKRSDPRAEVSPPKGSEVFQAALDAMQKDG